MLLLALFVSLFIIAQDFRFQNIVTISLTATILPIHERTGNHDVWERNNISISSKIKSSII